MDERKGEKAGWTWGFFGGFLWVALLAAVFFYQGKVREGTTGALIFAFVVAAVIYFSPWRHPSSSAWKLMLAPYALLAVSIAWAVWAFGGPEKAGLKWWNALWLAMLSIPFWTGGKRKWADGGAWSEVKK